jgi:maleate cis-trans isomerase
MRAAARAGEAGEAFTHLGVRRIALATPYARETTLRGKAHLEAHGIAVASWGNLEGVSNIYDETPQRAYELGRRVDSPEAQALFFSGLGLPTLDVLERLERELGKPVLSSCSAMMWRALRVAGVKASIPGYGRLLSESRGSES